jgi:hypothetical protein
MSLTPRKAYPSLQATDAFPITPADTANVGIQADAGNTKLYEFCYPHNYGTSGVVYVTPVDAADFSTSFRVPIYLAQGQTSDMLVKKVWAFSLGSGVLLTGKVGRGVI